MVGTVALTTTLLDGWVPREEEAGTGMHAVPVQQREGGIEVCVCGAWVGSRCA